MALKFGQKLKQIVGTVAPFLGTAIGGPLGGMAGKALQDALGVDTDEAALEALQTPDGLAKLKAAEASLKIRLEELGVDVEEIHQRDRDSARQRQIHTGDNTPQILAYVYSAMFFLLLAAKFYIVIAGITFDPIAMSTLDTATGVLFGMVYASKDYFFGSSSGSKAKTEMLGK
jgi:hypothetical protein